MVRNQNDEKVATGEAMVEFPRSLDSAGGFTRNWARHCGAVGFFAQKGSSRTNLAREPSRLF